MERISKKVLGYNVDLITFEEAVKSVLNMFEKKQSGHVITLNPEIIEHADRNKEFAKILNTSELVIPESSGIKLALKLKGINQEQIPGIDFAAKLLDKCSDRNYPVALIGAKEEIIQTTVKNLKEKHSTLNICYYKNGYFTEEEEKNIIDNIVNAHPKFVLVALGAPKQDFFIEKCKERLKDAVFIGIGGSFDVWSGKVQRAPFIFRRIGLEWFYRMCVDPKRIKRVYKTLPLFLFKVIIEALKEKMCVKGK